MTPFKFSIACWLLATCAVSALLARPATLQFIQCPFERDSHQWLPAGYTIKPDSGIVQYYPLGESVEGWTERVTMQWFENVSLSPSQYIQAFLNGLQALFPQQLISHNPVRRTNLSTLEEWWSESSNCAVQYGLAKAFVVPPHIYLLTYTLRDSTKIQTARPLWKRIFLESRLITSAIENEEF